jgi:hypothetical protein
VLAIRFSVLANGLHKYRQAGGRIIRNEVRIVGPVKFRAESRSFFCQGEPSPSLGTHHAHLSP